MDVANPAIMLAILCIFALGCVAGYVMAKGIDNDPVSIGDRLDV